MDIPSLFNISEDDFDKEFFELFDLVEEVAEVVSERERTKI